MEDRNKLLLKAQRFVQKGYLDKAVKEYKKILDMSPDDITVRLRLGEVYVRMGKKAEAVKEYTEVAKFHAKSGFFLKSIAVYKQILKIDDRNIDVRIQLAELYNNQGIAADAIFQYMIAMKKYENKGKNDAVVDVLKKILAISPDNTEVQRRLKEKLEESGLVEETTGEPGESVVKQPEAPPAPQDVVGKEVVEEIENSVEEKIPEVNFDLSERNDSDNLSNLEEFTAGETEDDSDLNLSSELKNGIEKGLNGKDEYDPEVYYYRGIAHMEIGLYDQAIAEFKVSSKANDLAFDSYTRLGLCCMAKKVPEEAINFFKKGLQTTAEQDDGYIGLSYELGLAYEATGKKDKALEIFKKIGTHNKNYREVGKKIKTLSAGNEDIPLEDNRL
jgi:tetratricopeptide (TPR) repeat protein